jgi:hypothetical protein
VIDIDEPHSNTEYCLPEACIPASSEPTPTDSLVVPEPASEKPRRFRIAQDDPELAYSACKNYKKEGRALSPLH